MSKLNEGTLVVTGGAGLIGSAIIWGLNNRNLENIWLVDWAEQNSLKERNLTPLSYSRLLSPESFRKMVKEKSRELSEISAIFHLGACSAPPKQMKNI